MKNITVFCGSSISNNEVLINQAYELGKFLAKRNIALIYGGAKIGLMGKVADGVLDHAGEAIGIIPKFLTSKEVLHEGLSRIIVTETMHERKEKMHNLCDGFITLPGGFGTLEELFEALTWSQLGLHQKPIGILNSNGFYNDMLKFIDQMITSELLKPSNKELLIVSDTIQDLFQQMGDFVPHPVPKWMNKNL
ncbi:MAG: TIGR00730 family Rossman fold protein [Flavobacteriaceae bacterium]|nr:TIGR00730 family Rossman fold protein [Flavobacteriaceae bacterium]